MNRVAARHVTVLLVEALEAMEPDRIDVLASRSEDTKGDVICGAMDRILVAPATPNSLRHVTLVETTEESEGVDVRPRASNETRNRRAQELPLPGPAVGI